MTQGYQLEMYDYKAILLLNLSSELSFKGIF
jgi:hypothetical protein